jgi:GT2 family glycosyltransferase
MTFAAAIIAWNGEATLRSCLDSVLHQSTPPARVLVLDNASTDSTPDIAQRCAPAAEARGIALTVARQSTNLGFTVGANTAIRLLLDAPDAPDAVLLLNQDVCLDPSWCGEVDRAFAAGTRVGIVGSLLLFPGRETVQHAGGYLERPRLIGRHIDHHARVEVTKTEPSDAEFVTGAAIAIRTEVLRTIGAFADVFSPGYYEDVDLCDRARAAGWAVRYWPGAVATHVESAAFSGRWRRLRLSHRNRLLYALPAFADAGRRAEFVAAELAYVAASPHPDEVVAIASAASAVLVALPQAVAARLPKHETDEPLHRDLVHALIRIRTAALAAVRTPRAV